MRTLTLLRRSLLHYWRTNLAVVAGVAIAVAVLAGALIVGVSVRASLRDLAMQRIGHTDQAVLSSGMFRDGLAGELAAPNAPLIMLEGMVTSQNEGRRAARAQVYGIDDRFWQFHGLPEIKAPTGNDVYLSRGLADELGVQEGGPVVLRVEAASGIPTESLHGRKDDLGRSARLNVRRVLAAGELGEFSLNPRQGVVRAIFGSLDRVQALLEQPGRVNAVLVAQTPPGALEQKLRQSARLDDYGLRLRVLSEQGSLGLESTATILSDSVADAAGRIAEQLKMSTVPTLTYLANSISAGDRQIPYSVVTAIDLHELDGLMRSAQVGTPVDTDNAIVLNTWAANDLNARVGDAISLDYYVWEAEGRLSTRTASFRVAGVIPIEGAAADRDLVPQYPGITDSNRLADWDPPFPIDLRRVRPIDENYWNRYRGTPKAFVSIDAGTRLWRSRFGSLTALRIRPPSGFDLSQARTAVERALLANLEPQSHGFSVIDVRAQSLGASEGATDFGEYFTYFSAFLVASALLLAALFFRLGVEQRLAEIGLLQALGLDRRAIERLFVGEGLVLATIGALAGVAGAVAYGALIMYGLRTWWVGAVGTTALSLHADAQSLALGALLVVVVAVVCVWGTLRSLRRSSTRGLLKGSELRFTQDAKLGSDPNFAIGVALALAATAMLTAANDGWIGRVAGFFGAGSATLAAALCVFAAWLRGNTHAALDRHGFLPVWRLGFRNATHRPARSVLCMALIAFATFVIVAVEAFKRDDSSTWLERHSGVGGYSVLLESLLPIVYDLNTDAGRDALNLPNGPELAGVRFERFRVRPGEDTSCLNLYQPRNPRILGVPPGFVDAQRFAFQSSLAETDEEKTNPWLLLNRSFADGAIPVIADANSMTYVLHMKLGDDLVLPGDTDRPITLRLVAALADSLFQSELLMAESHFVRTFPEWDGYRFFLGETSPERVEAVSAVMESRLADLGVDAVSTTERLAGFHRVEYTYLSTFQMLGGLGLLLGTLGLGAVLLRNVLERRHEIALLRALGYRHSDLVTIVVAENVLLLVCGLVTGTVGALLAIAPSLIDRGGRLPSVAVGLLLLGVFATGLVASFGATIAALRAPLLPALKAE